MSFRIRTVGDLIRTIRHRQLTDNVKVETPLSVQVYVDGYVHMGDNQPRLDLLRLDVHSIAVLKDDPDNPEVVLLARRPDVADPHLPKSLIDYQTADQ